MNEREEQDQQTMGSGNVQMPMVDPVKNGRFGQLDFVAFQETETLPPNDPDEELLAKDHPIWSKHFKHAVRVYLMEAHEEKWFDASDLLQYLPLQTQPWDTDHKALAILVSRMQLGQEWIEKLQLWEFENDGGMIA